MARKSKTTGGRALKQFLRDAKRAESRSSSVEVGFHATARYDDGTPTALVAAVHEFGLANQTEQPFFRTAIASSKRTLREVIRAGIDPLTMTFSETTARQAGEVLKDAVRQNIEDAGLVDSGKLKASVDVRVGPARSR